MGGSDDPSNLVLLTIEEHAEAHRILFEEHGRIEDYYAWKGLLGVIPKAEILRGLQSYYAKNKTEEHKENIRRACREAEYPDRAGSNNPVFGRPRSESEKKAISEKMKGRSSCRWVTNGSENRYIMKDLPTPNGWRNGRTIKNRDVNGVILKVA